MNAQSTKLAYQELITLFAELFKYPDEEIEKQIMDGTADEEMNRALATCGITFQEPLKPLATFMDDENRVSKQHMKAFSGLSKPFYPPVESLYKVWSKDPETPGPMKRKKGYYMGDSALHMRHLLQQFGFSVPDQFTMMPDHLSIELEMYHHLIDTDSESAIQFHEDHLDWVGDFKKDIMQLDDAPFYQEVTKRLRFTLMKDPVTLLT